MQPVILQQASEASLAISSILSRAEGSAKNALSAIAPLSTSALGAELDRVLRPAGASMGGSAREAAAHSAFWEGAVLLEPVPAMAMEDLVPSYVEALDRHLLSLGVNPREPLPVGASESRAAVQRTRAAFVEEVVAGATLGRQFSAALGQLLQHQANVRPVSHDEHAFKVGWMRERLSRLFDNMLERAKRQATQTCGGAGASSARSGASKKKRASGGRAAPRAPKRKPQDESGAAPDAAAGAWRAAARPVVSSAAPVVSAAAAASSAHAPAVIVVATKNHAPSAAVASDEERWPLDSERSSSAEQQPPPPPFKRSRPADVPPASPSVCGVALVGQGGPEEGSLLASFMGLEIDTSPPLPDMSGFPGFDEKLAGLDDLDIGFLAF